MRAIAEPKFNRKVIATKDFKYVDGNERNYLNAVVQLTTVSLDIGEIHFYVDFLNSGLKDGGALMC